MRTVRTPEQFPPFHAVGWMLPQSVFLQSAGSGELVGALGADEHRLVGAVDALEVSLDVTLSLEKLVALRTRERSLELVLEFFMLIHLLPGRRLVIIADVAGGGN